MARNNYNRPSRRNSSRVFNERRDRNRMVREYTQLNFAIMLRVLHDVYEWNSEQIGDFLEAYVALMTEVGDGRASIDEEIDACKELTGFNPKTILTDIEQGRLKF